jgi:hypothetical protein
VRQYPIHVAAQWVGHNPAVALQHYLQVTETDLAGAAMQQAVGFGSGNGHQKKRSQQRSHLERF